MAAGQDPSLYNDNYRGPDDGFIDLAQRDGVAGAFFLLVIHFRVHDGF